jgi:hypothetical protein
VRHPSFIFFIFFFIPRSCLPVHQLALTDFSRYDSHGEEFDRLYLKHVPLSTRSARLH